MKYDVNGSFHSFTHCCQAKTELPVSSIGLFDPLLLQEDITKTLDPVLAEWMQILLKINL